MPPFAALTKLPAAPTTNSPGAHPAPCVGHSRHISKSRHEYHETRITKPASPNQKRKIEIQLRLAYRNPSIHCLNSQVFEAADKNAQAINCTTFIAQTIRRISAAVLRHAPPVPVAPVPPNKASPAPANRKRVAVPPIVRAQQSARRTRRDASTIRETGTAPIC